MVIWMRTLCQKYFTALTAELHSVAEMNVLNDLKYSIVHSPVEVLMYCPVLLMYCAVEVLMVCKLLIMRDYPVNDDQCVCVCVKPVGISIMSVTAVESLTGR